MTIIASLLPPAGWSEDKGVALWFGPQTPQDGKHLRISLFTGQLAPLVSTIQNWAVTAISKWKARLPASIPSKSTRDLSR